MHYLKIPKILGTVKSKEYVGWIPLDAISFDELHRDVGFDEAGSVKQGLLRRGDIRVSRQSDRSSREIMSASLTGMHFAEVKIAIGATSEKKHEAYLFTLTDVLLPLFSLSGEGNDPRETFTLNCKDYRVKALS